ncbi:hypothetical protein BCR32DRAFT_284524 [Anaeromyces robustus]|uniref:Uncharacterized protein n=1 Tax=Anaeromyces robustus TaxID=1754192 RepID=A0A1Y1WRF7_9FUNG|nr:hypothetical protein BCR32DRAFT_284524 [Anaeromyces robustus]|eukprot:ORX76119.1 hypothetical protein BCR32DRAFT_284524 [Anaeromyces robustus]
MKNLIHLIYFTTEINFDLVCRKQEVSTDWPYPRCKQLNKLGATKCSSCCEDPIIY